MPRSLFKARKSASSSEHVCYLSRFSAIAALHEPQALSREAEQGRCLVDKFNRCHRSSQPPNPRSPKPTGEGLTTVCPSVSFLSSSTDFQSTEAYSTAVLASQVCLEVAVRKHDFQNGPCFFNPRISEHGCCGWYQKEQLHPYRKKSH